MRPDIKTETLITMYFEEKLSAAEISARVGMAPSSVQYRLRSADLALRTRQDARLLLFEKRRAAGIAPLPKTAPSSRYDAEIRRMYEDEKMSTPEIGKRLGLGHSTVQRRLRVMKVPLRSRGPRKKWATE